MDDGHVYVSSAASVTKQNFWLNSALKLQIKFGRMTTNELPMSARVGAGSTFSAASAPPKGLLQCEDFLQFEVRR